MILDEVKEAYVKDLLRNGKREDGRGLLDYRPIQIEKGYLPNAEGSALAHIGETKVLAGVKFDMMTPFTDRPKEGVFMVNAEFLPLAHPSFEAGPPNENSIELARVVDRGIRAAKAINMDDFFIEEGKVLGLFVDVYVLDHSGNMTDTAALAAMAALQDTRIPKVEEGKIIRKEYSGPLQLNRTVVTTSFEKVNGSILLDATTGEETASEGRLTLATCSDELVCAAQKSGRAGFSTKLFDELIDKAFSKRTELVAALQKG